MISGGTLRGVSKTISGVISEGICTRFFVRILEGIYGVIHGFLIKKYI